MKTGRITSHIAVEALSTMCDETFAAGQRREDHRRELWALNEALADAKAARAHAPRPTSALLDGSAAERRLARMERRAVGGVVGSAPSAGRPVASSDGEEAA